MRKLIMYVVLIVVLIVVIVGFTGAFDPLIDRVEGKLNEVSIYMNIREGGSSRGDCFEDQIVNLPKGKEFLDKLDLTDRSSAVFRICKNGECKVNMDSKSYRIDEGNFDFLGDDDEWYPALNFMIPHNDQEKLSEIKLYWELYNGVVDMLVEDDSYYSFYYWHRLTRQFVLYGNGNGLLDKEVYAIWRNGKWTVEEVGGKVLYEGSDDDLAIDFFIKEINDWLNDEVYYSWESPQRKISINSLQNPIMDKPIYDLIELAKNKKLDSDKDVADFKERFQETKELFLEEVKVEEKDFSEFKKIIDGKIISAGGKNYDVKIVESYIDDVPYVELVSGDEVYFLRFDIDNLEEGFEYYIEGEDGEYSLVNASLSNYPLVLIKEAFGKVIYERYYKLPKDIFDKSYEASLIFDFIRERCDAM